MGSMRPDGDQPTIFLVKGDRVLMIKQGDVIENTYKVDGIQDKQVTFTYLPRNIQQTLAVPDTK
jgi:hypothetical protein